MYGNVAYNRFTCLSKQCNRSKSHAIPTFFEIGVWSHDPFQICGFSGVHKYLVSIVLFQTPNNNSFQLDFPIQHVYPHPPTLNHHPLSPTMPTFSWKKIKEFGISETEKDRFCAIFLTNVDAFKASSSRPFTLRMTNYQSAHRCSDGRDR